MDLSRINLNLLCVLQQLLALRSVSAAARALNLTQPAISRSLAQLREQFDDPLLVRVGNQMQLTPRAEELQRQLPPVLQQLEAFFTPGHFNAEQFSGRFNIAITDYIAEHILPELVGRLSAEVSGLRLHFRLWEPGMLADLREGRLDMAACVLDEVPDDIYGQEAGRDTYVCLMRRDHPLCSQTLDLQAYIEAGHISISGGGDKNRAVDDALSRLGLHRSIRVSVPFIQASLAFTAQSDLLLTLPAHMAHSLAASFDLSIHPLPLAVEEVRYYLLWHRRQQHDPAHRFIREQFNDVLASSPFSRSP
ncbi:LysR family transcriptional regulator [Marinobacterium zhoushanense]|uniref:LysR family transcriptional regulator n=1 Tax=Marinobacterium zhoushanense TaxID=1679163 RepID=A0ABQ1K5C4_9GAMM|nr:LysR family transcriptional regulator [Marinobacterium zhoushanense]GGB88532.1 LysR family transcriptional regulator [Marinobacterium zhoushanense]